MKGEYKHSIDAKGRLAMPAKLREELGEHFTVTKGLDGCLSVYPEAEWKRLEDKIRTLGNGEKARRVKRYYFANAEIWNSDKWRAYNDEIDAEVVAADVEDIDF